MSGENPHSGVRHYTAAELSGGIVVHEEPRPILTTWTASDVPVFFVVASLPEDAR